MWLTVGSDAEVFVQKGGFVINAGRLDNIIPGTKSNPYLVRKGALQIDGMALEFNVDPTNDMEEWDNNFITVMQQMRERVDGYQFSKKSWHVFDEKYMSQQPEKDKEVGCDPDMDAYTGKWNDSPPSSSLLRTVAGHIHIGWGDGLGGDGHKERCMRVAQVMDVVLGVPSVVEDVDGADRRSLYGKAGACRIKPYGVEYRVLSNYWIFSSDMRKKVFQRVQDGVKNFVRCEKHAEFARHIINNNDVNAAKEMMDVQIPQL